MTPPMPTERTLHVHCGDISAAQLRRSGVPGEVHVIHDPVCWGPVPSGKEDGAWYRMRAEFLVGIGVPVPAETLAKNLAAEESVLDGVSARDDVVLWFDACLFDQAILVRVLDRLSRAVRGPARVLLLCIGEFPGFARFKGLGELSPEQMASLLPRRREVTAPEWALASRAWAALRAPDPREVETFLAGDTTALPYVGDAWRRHLEEFPSVRNGLGRTDNECLDAVDAGASGLAALFRAVSDMESRPFLGDTMLWDRVDRLARGSRPALRVEGPGPVPRWDTPRDPDAWQATLTDTGRALRRGGADWRKLNAPDEWRGGVCLGGRGGAEWRWDEGRRRLVR